MTFLDDSAPVPAASPHDRDLLDLAGEAWDWAVMFLLPVSGGAVFAAVFFAYIWLRGH